MTDISPADFFERLAKDPDVQIPLLLVMLDKAVAESTEYRAYSALQQAIEKAGVSKTPDQHAQ